ncbi:MAG: hypothetical protein WDW38_011044 [Sanguina aurantia]
MGALGCWPVYGAPNGNVETPPVPVAVFAVVTVEADAFDVEMCLLFDEIADAAGLALRQHDQRRALFNEQQRQTYLALHDALTGLPNRRALDRHLERVLAKAKRLGHIVALGLLDVDDLKPINDRHGHAMGDRILIQVASRLRSSLRREDYVARLGGDEFVLVFEQLAQERDLDPLLAAVGDALQQPLLIDGETFLLSASLGMAMFPTHADASGEQLLRHADQAMYQVKAQKRKRRRWWSLPVAAAAVASGTVPAPLDGGPPLPYGEATAEQLQQAMVALAPRLPQVLEDVYAELLLHEGVAALIAAYPADDTAQTAWEETHVPLQDGDWRANTLFVQEPRRVAADLREPRHCSQHAVIIKITPSNDIMTDLAPDDPDAENNSKLYPIPLCLAAQNGQELTPPYSTAVCRRPAPPEDQQAFVEQLKTVLDLALSRLAPPRPGAELLPFPARAVADDDRHRRRADAPAADLLLLLPAAGCCWPLAAAWAAVGAP